MPTTVDLRKSAFGATEHCSDDAAREVVEGVLPVEGPFFLFISSMCRSSSIFDMFRVNWLTTSESSGIDMARNSRSS